MALSANTTNKILGGDYSDHPVHGSTHIYEGALVVIDADGYAIPLTADTHNGRFAGVAVAEADNSSGADGAINCKLRRGDFYAEMTLASAALADVGDALYATDDATLTKSSTSSTLLGKIAGYVTTNTIIAKLATDV